MPACVCAAGDARERINSRRCAPPSKDPLPGRRPNMFLEKAGMTHVGKIVDKEDQLTNNDQEEDVVVYERGGRGRKR